MAGGWCMATLASAAAVDRLVWVGQRGMKVVQDFTVGFAGQPEPEGAPACC